MKNRFNSVFFKVILAIACLIFGFLLFALSDKGDTLLNTPSGTVVAPVQSIFTRIGNGFSNFFSRFTNYENLQKENEVLKEQINNYETQIRDNEALKSENESLKELLGLKEQSSDYEFAPALVVSKNMGEWFNYFTINKGTLSGIKRGCPVITSDGLVGIVVSAGPTYAKVETIINSGNVVGAMLMRTMDAAICEGDLRLSENGYCKLTFISKATNINRGDLVYTSGLGGLYPEGLKIGKIESFEDDENGISEYAIIDTSVSFDNLKQVYVITSFEGQSYDIEAQEDYIDAEE